MSTDIRARLEELRAELRAERISYGELLELQGLAEHIEAGDVELLEAAGVPEFEEETTMTEATQALTQLEFEPDDFEKAEKIAGALGFEQHAYTSTSALWGLFCLPENPDYAKPGQATKGGCIIKTRELGFLFVQDGEDLHLGYQFKAVI